MSKADQQLKEILDKIVGNVFGYQNPFTPEQFVRKFAFDVRLPKQTYDSTTNEETWAQSLAPNKFITMKNANDRAKHTDWGVERRPLSTIEDLLAAWADTNYTTSERYVESINASESDNVYNSENVFRSLDVHESKNIAYCDGAWNCEYVTASQRSNTSVYSIRLEDSKECSNSFNVIWSGKIANSMFIQDCWDMYECLFCSHMESKKFCIANMQFTEEEYRKLKKLVIEWVLSS
jgi:hypothetical protein